jgi:hypothetical protein
VLDDLRSWINFNYERKKMLTAQKAGGRYKGNPCIGGMFRFKLIHHMTFTMLDAPGSDQYAVVDASHVRGEPSDDRWRPPIPSFWRVVPFR